MSKQGSAKNRKSDSNAPKKKHKFSEDFAAIIRRREKIERTGRVDPKDYPKRFLTRPRILF